MKTSQRSQIKALLKKDLLVRLRQPWMTIVQFVWPCLIFVALYSLRHRFQAEVIEDCQFPTRLLPAKNNLLPFFHSYICTIENACERTVPYEETMQFNDVPFKLVVNIVQNFLNEESLYSAITNLPEKMNFISAALAITSSPIINDIMKDIEKVIEQGPKIQKAIGDSFDVKKIFSDSKTFSKAGTIICGKPFPQSDNIRFINNILYSEDFSEVNDEELDAMPTKYCKQLYLDVTSSNQGKITWSQIKPIIQGRIVYAPENEETAAIISQSNFTYNDMHRLQIFAESLHKVIVKLRTDEQTHKNFKSFISLAKNFIGTSNSSPISINQIEHFLMEDKSIADVIEIVHNILQCFNVNRFVPVNSSREMQDIAVKLNEKNLFLAGIYFNNTNSKHISYEIRMKPDNSPITAETKSRFWFPGPEGSMVENMRYHRGFVQMKHAIDIGVIKYKKQLKLRNETKPVEKEEDPFDDWFKSFYDNSTPKDTSVNLSKTDTSTDSSTESITKMPSNVLNAGSFLDMLFKKPEVMPPSISDENSTTMATPSITESSTESETVPKSRKRRQLSGLLGGLLGKSKKTSDDKFDVDNVVVHTKQFPYPQYTRDDFKRGLYLAQSVQMAFFMALIAQIATCVRYRIWMKESKNTMLMKSMGLKTMSEVFSWVIITFVEMLIVFIIACIILYSGGIMKYTNVFVIGIFLIIFGISIISFCYLCSNIYSSASLGSVASTILFLISFMPYIVIICLDTTMTPLLKFATNLSPTTAFCYAWDNIMRFELQEKGLTFTNMYQEGFKNDFTYAVCMIVLDIVLYAVVGVIIDYLKNDEFKFHAVPRENLESDVGASIESASVIYPQGKVAISCFTTVFLKNKVTSLLGRNGAGKSTIIKLLTGQVKPTSGLVSLPRPSSGSTKYDQVGLCSQDNILIPQLTAKEHLEMYAKLKLGKNFDVEVMKTMRGLNFGKYEHYEACNLSGGYQRRLCVAIAFIGSPNVVILDEPCNGVDSKARKCVWDLIESLRKNRAVIVATHHLDEAEYLSDSVLILHEGKLMANHNTDDLKELFTKTFTLSIQLPPNQNNTRNDVKTNIDKYLERYSVEESSENDLKFSVHYNHDGNQEKELFEYLENLQNSKKIENFTVNSKSLEEIFEKLRNGNEQTNGYSSQIYDRTDLGSNEIYIKPKLSIMDVIRSLLWKRFLHFRRNYRLLLTVLVLPIIFEVIAMSFMQLRPTGQYDHNLNLSKAMYGDSTEFLSMENGINFSVNTYDKLNGQCQSCERFNTSEKTFKWILNTHGDYLGKRYGGITFNKSFAHVWYNNKGYHSMLAWLNDLNNQMIKVELNDDEYGITSFNRPIKIGEKELSTSSILQQVSDAGVSLILLIAFSSVVAGASVFIVNERVSGEKLQQKLCGVKFHTYWGIAFFWDFLVYLAAVALCAGVLKLYNLPIYIDKSNLNGICLLLVLYGFACISVVHVVEKFFAEASFANMTIFCLNVIIPLATLTIVILFDILGESDESDRWRNILNRVFLIFPQHALTDGLIEICKNYIVANVFTLYDIDSYKSPVSSNLLIYHYASLIGIGLIFIFINYFIENRILKKCLKKIYKDPTYELRIVSIQNSTNQNGKSDNMSGCSALKIENLSKAYKRKDYAVEDVSFQIQIGECFGLLGKNGAGKSTIFKILSGQLQQTSGTVNFFNGEIGYCPQTSPLDPLLTVREMIEIYGKLRKINNISKLLPSTLESFHLEPYKNVLVKNLSGGNRRKLSVAISCFGNTNIVLMDEPTSDMDPVTRSLVYKTIQNLVCKKRSVLLTSHTVSEIEHICNRIALLKNGQLIATNSPKDLHEKFGNYYQVTIFSDSKRDEGILQRDIKDTLPQMFDLQVHPNCIRFIVKVQSQLNENNTNKNIVYPKTNELLSVKDLLIKLKDFTNKYSIQYTLHKCRLDMVIENMLESNEANENGIPMILNQTESIT